MTYAFAFEAREGTTVLEFRYECAEDDSDPETLSGANETVSIPDPSAGAEILSVKKSEQEEKKLQASRAATKQTYISRTDNAIIFLIFSTSLLF